MSLSQEKSKKKSYLPPSLSKRSFPQATLLLTGHAWIGDTGARELLELLFPEPGPEQ
jgi:hypothetical protein